MPPQPPPLEARPIGPRRTIQKIFADKDLRDAWIAELEKAVGNAQAWAAELRIDCRESGTIKLTYGGHAGPRLSRRANPS